MNLKNRLRMSITGRHRNVVLRSDFSDLGAVSSLNKALVGLVHDGELMKLSPGIYAKTIKDADGRTRLAAPEQQVAQEVFARLGTNARLVGIESKDGEMLYVVETANTPVSRSLKLGHGKVVHRRAESRREPTRQPELSIDVDELPKRDVGDFVRRYAAAHHVVYMRSRLDDWAEAVTRAAGDDVRLDDTEKLLVALTKKHLITGRQAARLLTNYMAETAGVRSVQRL